MDPCHRLYSLVVEVGRLSDFCESMRGNGNTPERLLCRRRVRHIHAVFPGVPAEIGIGAQHTSVVGPIEVKLKLRDDCGPQGVSERDILVSRGAGSALPPRGDVLCATK